MKLVIVSENISMKMGGEASLGLYYFRLFRTRGVDTIAVCHGRVRDEMDSILPREDRQRFHYVEDTVLQRMVWRMGAWFPPRIRDLVFGQIIHILTMRRVRRVVLRLSADCPNCICLEPSPITPRGVSFMYDIGMPVVIGPLCGGLQFPPAFKYMDNAFARLTIPAFRAMSEAVHRLIPGKLRADAILVANSCTKRALPSGCRGTVYEVVESGVDLSIWHPMDSSPFERRFRVHFVFSGRLVELKGVSLLVEAFSLVAQKEEAVLHIIGDGELRSEIERTILDRGIAANVLFHGWKSRPEAAGIIRNCDVFVLPSLRECGGTAILEAMALGLPVIASNWAGPSNYVTQKTGILVDPLSREYFIQGLSSAMLRLSENPDLRTAMGRAGMERVRSCYFDWESKADRVLEILAETSKHQ